MWRISSFASIVIIAFLGNPSLGGYLYPWSAVPTFTDAPDPGLPGAQDILAVWHAYDGNFHYFRLDLRSAPVPNDSSSPDIYGIYIDAIPDRGGYNTDVVQYIPNELTGIDFIADSHFGSTGFFRSEYHVWDFYAGFYRLDIDAHQESENGGTTLEWMVAAASIGSDFTFSAADLNLGFPSTTHDVLGPIAVPEPTAALFWAFVMACSSLKRRNLVRRRSRPSLRDCFITWVA